MTNITANVRFNKLLAKNQFKYDSLDDARLGIASQMAIEHSVDVVENRKKAREVINPDGSLEEMKEKVAEGYLFLKDDSAVEISLVQFQAYGVLRFVYVLKCVTI